MRFEGFVFDHREQTLRRDDTLVPLPPKAAAVLALLLESPGALVTKEHIFTTLWPDGFVEDGNLTQTVYVLRKALDRSGDGRRFIETVPRRGYRFALPVEPVPVPVPVPAPAVAPPRTPSSWMRQARRIAMTMAAALALSCGLVTGAAQSGAHVRPVPPEVQRQFDLGQYWWNMRTLPATRKSIALFTEVVKEAPWSPLGYVGLAEAYVMIANHNMIPGQNNASYARAAGYAKQALERDPKSGEAIALLGFIALDRDKNLNAAERALRTGTALQPGYASGHEFLGTLALDRGDLATADTQMRRAIELEPTSPMVLAWYGIVQYYVGRYDDASTALRESFDLQRSNTMAAYYLILADVAGKRFSEARAVLAPFKGTVHHVELASLTAYVDLHSGRRAEALREMPDLRPRRLDQKHEHLDAVTLAALCLDLGRRADAVSWLRRAMTDPEWRGMQGEVRGDPRIRTIANDPELRALAV